MTTPNLVVTRASVAAQSDIEYFAQKPFVMGSEKRDHFMLNMLFCHFSNCHHSMASRAPGFPLGF